MAIVLFAKDGGVKGEVSTLGALQRLTMNRDDGADEFAEAGAAVEFGGGLCAADDADGLSAEQDWCSG